MPKTTLKKKHLQPTDLHGASKLAIDATIGLTNLVETMHHNILRAPTIFGTVTEEPTRGITGLVYRSIRGVTRAVGGGLDLTLGQLAGLLNHEPSSSAREAVVSALNGVLGDHLLTSQNPLAIQMQLRRDGAALTLTKKSLARAIAQPTGKILLLVHGLCMSDLQWNRNGHDHGAAMVADPVFDVPFTAVYLHYDSGLHISDNGSTFANLIEALLKAWPVPVEELNIIGHSMGGLVTRSACEIAWHAGHAWPHKLKKIIFLGTPHFGAPLERGGNWINVILDTSPYTTAFARLAKIRSAGITDLRHADVHDTGTQKRDRFASSKNKTAHEVPLPTNVRCYAIAAALGKKSGSLTGSMFGDGLVPVTSALGQHDEPARTLGIPKSRQWIGYEMNHMDLLDRQDVYRRIRKWLLEKS
jgi:pimeloyl-ACP methyl ester carboxylesterase